MILLETSNAISPENSLRLSHYISRLLVRMIADRVLKETRAESKTRTSSFITNPKNKGITFLFPPEWKEPTDLEGLKLLTDSGVREDKRRTTLIGIKTKLRRAIKDYAPGEVISNQEGYIHFTDVKYIDFVGRILDGYVIERPKQSGQTNIEVKDFLSEFQQICNNTEFTHFVTDLVSSDSANLRKYEFYKQYNSIIASIFYEGRPSVIDNLGYHSGVGTNVVKWLEKSLKSKSTDSFVKKRFIGYIVTMTLDHISEGHSGLAKVAYLQEIKRSLLQYVFGESVVDENGINSQILADQITRLKIINNVDGLNYLYRAIDLLNSKKFVILSDLTEEDIKNRNSLLGYLDTNSEIDKDRIKLWLLEIRRRMKEKIDRQNQEFLISTFRPKIRVVNNRTQITLFGNT